MLENLSDFKKLEMQPIFEGNKVNAIATDAK